MNFARRLPERAFDAAQLREEAAISRSEKIERTARNIVIAYDNLHQWPEDQAAAALDYSVSLMRTLVKV